MRKLIAVSEVLGGAVGLLGLASAAATVGRALPTWYWLLAISCLLLSLYAGWLLYRDQPWGVDLSLGVQIAQIFSVATVSVFARLLAGPHLTLWISSEALTVQLGAGGGVAAYLLHGVDHLPPTLVGASLGLTFVQQFIADSGTVPPMIGINLFAIWAVVTLVRSSSVTMPKVELLDRAV